MALHGMEQAAEPVDRLHFGLRSEHHLARHQTTGVVLRHPSSSPPPRCRQHHCSCREHPGAAASPEKGWPRPTATRVGITGKLKLTLQSTNPCESMISTVRVIQRNVKHWSSGEMCMRWTAAETNFRILEGYRALAQLAVKVEADLIRRPNNRHKNLTAALDL